MEKTILSLIDHVQESAFNADISVVSALCESYAKECVMFRETDSVVQEGFKDDLNGPILGTKDESVVKRIAMVIPRLIAKIAELLNRAIRTIKGLIKKQKNDVKAFDKMIKENEEAINEKFQADGIIEVPLHFQPSGYPLKYILDDLDRTCSFLGTGDIPTYKQYDSPEIGAVKVWTPNSRGGVPVIKFLTKVNDDLATLVDSPVKFTDFAQVKKYRDDINEYEERLDIITMTIFDFIDDYKKYFETEIPKYIDHLTGDQRAQYSSDVATALANIAKAVSITTAIDSRLRKFYGIDRNSLHKHLNDTTWLDYGKDSINENLKRVVHEKRVKDGTDFDELGNQSVDLKLNNMES